MILAISHQGAIGAFFAREHLQKSKNANVKSSRTYGYKETIRLAKTSITLASLSFTEMKKS